MYTYIIKTTRNEYYCGKTTDLFKRLNEHISEKRPHWFAYNNRKKFMMIYTFKGDYERKIKKFGIKNFCEVLKQI